MLNVQKLDNLYKSYYYTIEDVSNENVRAYCIDTGMYKNIDIVPISNIESIKVKSIKKDLENSGFSCIIREYNSISDAENKLYHGFFNVRKNIDRLKREYKDFKNRIEKVLAGNSYEYINCDYYLDNESKNAENNNIIDDIVQKIDSEGARLIIIEASAGLGKTCTAYETLIRLIELDNDKIPLVMELSRNRQAPIFKYILLSEIDRTFANSIKLDLVKKQIITGNVILIVDGFDELLKSKVDEANSFEDTEPMLETIKELLHGNTKIILTSRKTAILQSDGFYDWLEDNGADFKFSRFELKPPKIENWLGMEKNRLFKETNMPESTITNPVILSYLNNVDIEYFSLLVKTPELIIEKYINTLLEREKERQDLILDIDEQISIFEDISQYFITSNISSDESESLLIAFQDRNLELLFKIASRYSSESNISAEKICGKLINHALFDRKDNDYIGFVNDFIFGYFIASSLINMKTDNIEEYLFDEIYSERAIDSFKFVNEEKRNQLWNKLSYLSNYYEINLLLKYDMNLKNKILHNICDKIIEKKYFDNINFNHKCKNTTFMYCKFNNCEFLLTEFVNVSFLYCSFNNCIINNTKGEKVTLIHSNFYQSNDLRDYDEGTKIIDDRSNVKDFRKIVLERFWPIGREIFKPKKPLRTLYSGQNPNCHKQIGDAINSLKKEDLISINRNTNFALLNTEKIADIKNILDR